MPSIIKPDLKAVVWLAAGFFLVPVVLKYLPIGKG